MPRQMMEVLRLGVTDGDFLKSYMWFRMVSLPGELYEVLKLGEIDERVSLFISNVSIGFA